MQDIHDGVDDPAGDCAGSSAGQGRGSKRADALFSPFESGPDTDPDSRFWGSAPSLIAARDGFGNAVPGHETTIRIAWTLENLYFLFICPYLELNLRPEPNTREETNGLWNWDVAEVFVGSDFDNIRRYREFEVSPQGEWVDIDVDLDKGSPEEGWRWISGCEAAARIDALNRIWYGFMRIPYKAVDSRPAAAGNLLRANFFRSQGAGPNRREITWQPTHALTFHVPESFGTIRLVKV